jgi:hypothetical protein
MMLKQRRQARLQLGNPVNQRSQWDPLHPGREWADATTDNQKPPATIIEQIGAHLATHRPYADIHQIFGRFTEDMHQLNRRAFPRRRAASSNWSWPATLVLSSSYARSVIIDASPIATALPSL